MSKLKLSKVLSSEYCQELNGYLSLIKLFGLFPYNRDLSFSHWWFIYSTLIHVGLGVAGSYRIFVTENTTNAGDPYLDVLEKVMITSLGLGVECSFFTGLTQRDVFEQYLREIHYFDVKYRFVGNPVKISHPIFNGVTSLGCVLTIFFADFSQSNITDVTPWLALQIFFYGSLTLQEFVMKEYILCLNLTKFRFELLAKVLGLYPQSWRSHQQFLVELVRAHNQLTDCCVTLNDSFTYQVLFFTMSSFVLLVLMAYYIFWNINQLLEKSTDSYYFVFVLTFWVTFYLWRHFSLNGATFGVVQQAKRFNDILCQIMINDETKELSHNEKLQLYVAAKKEVHFNACGFFTLNYPLITSMVGSATTYLVILIQFAPPSADTDDSEATALLAV